MAVPPVCSGPAQVGFAETPAWGLPHRGYTNYTYCFTGTLVATPMVSGAAALVLSVNDKLAQPQVKRLLQDTADKIQDSQSLTPANYDDLTGTTSR